MDNLKSKVIKSKSSNTAIVSQTENKKRDDHPESRRKKSKSNAEFQTLMVKKRGLFVEKKNTKILLNPRRNETTTEALQTPKAPKRPKAGTKRFLASVLTILAKSTTGTQYPEDDEQKQQKQKKKIDKKYITIENTEDAEKKDNTIKLTDIEIEKRKKPKFRSWALNVNKYLYDTLEVLQTKKDIVQSRTPSMYTLRSEDIKTWDLPRLVKPEEEENTVSNLVRGVSEGLKVNDNKTKVTEPMTLVSEHKEDKHLYNFFVDLLETTFNVYNVNTDCEPNNISAVSSTSITLAMNASVAMKLNVGTEMNHDMVEQKPSQHFYCLNSETRWHDERLIDNFQTSSTMRMEPRTKRMEPRTKRRLTSKSFDYTSTPHRNTNKLITQKSSFNRQNKKKDLLNLFKEQLTMDHLSFEEPQNLYQALRVMAKSKRKQTRFDNSAKKLKEGLNPDCTLKRRRVIVPAKKNAKENAYNKMRNDDVPKFSEVNGYRKVIDSNFRLMEMDVASIHSLEVYGMDYEEPYRRRDKKEDLYLRYHSTASSSDSDLKYQGSSSTIRDFLSS